MRKAYVGIRQAVLQLEIERFDVSSPAYPIRMLRIRTVHKHIAGPDLEATMITGFGVLAAEHQSDVSVGMLMAR